MSNDSSKLDKLPHAPEIIAAPEPKYPWSPLAAVVVVLVCIIVLPIVIEIGLSLIPRVLGWSHGRGSSWLRNSPLANFLYVLVAETLTIGVVYRFVHHRKISFKQAVSLRKPIWRDMGMAAIGLLAYIGIFIITLTVFQGLFHLNTSQQQALGFQKGVGGAGLVLAFLSLVVLPPVAEETLFRGFFFGTLRSRKMPFYLATLITSVFFGFFHLFGGTTSSLLWLAFLDTFVLSLVLCYLREKTGSIWASMLVHALKNGIVFINLFIITSR